jgi:hypothetical protein
MHGWRLARRHHEFSRESEIPQEQVVLIPENQPHVDAAAQVEAEERKKNGCGPSQELLQPSENPPAQGRPRWCLARA